MLDSLVCSESHSEHQLLKDLWKISLSTMKFTPGLPKPRCRYPLCNRISDDRMPFALATTDYRFHVPASAASTRTAWAPSAAGSASAASPPPPASSLSPFPSFTSSFNSLFFLNLVPTPRQNNLQEVFVSTFHAFSPHPFLILSSLSLCFHSLSCAPIGGTPNLPARNQSRGEGRSSFLSSAGGGRTWPLEHPI